MHSCYKHTSHFAEDNHRYAAVQDVLGSYRAQQQVLKTGPLRDSPKRDNGAKVVTQIFALFYLTGMLRTINFTLL